MVRCRRSRVQRHGLSDESVLDQGGHQVRHAFNGAPDLKAEMMVLLGNLYRELGELDSADSLLQAGPGAGQDGIR